ncbi:IclR family transcriptional regulator domain-containing protein [Salinisphaera aquimarina]|uniref:IclR family transcriptional regulator C-terminal domain-containing protein n=1 Tax=Salinisphaera aquimarina TaxID=2094031 RepID=A0ABV7EQE9_9GAMM
MSYAPVTALMRGLKVLEAVNRLGPARLTDIQAATGLPKASTLRVLDTLRHGGYVTVTPDSREYLVAARTLSLSNNYRADEALLAVAAPILQELREATGWPSDLAFYQAGKMVIADTNRRPGSFSVNRKVGTRVSVMLTAIGRVYLSFCSDAERADIIDTLVASDDRDEVGAADHKAVATMVEQIRTRGYAINERESVHTIRAVAVPVLHDGQVLCSFNVIGLAQAVPMADFEKTYIPMIQAARQRIEAALSSRSE